ncbi:TraX family protein [Peribacillus sp. NPDC006672]|uniref:TraX family protein n=1 Tax=Peribacillus sp. NPDC006672 TaxID=3390606 RepID=UPI003D009785
MTTTLLKLIALVSMFIDHTGQFIPDTPEYFRWIGRLAIPIFIYCVVLGYKHTSNRKKYMLRLYFSGVAMAFINLGINIAYSHTGVIITNNFFATLFVIVLVIYLLDKRQVRLYVYFILWQLISTILCVLFSEIIVINFQADHLFYGAILGNIFFVEGGMFFVLLGILLYLSRSKVGITIVYIIFHLIIFTAYAKWGVVKDGIINHLFPFSDYQWMMISALPLLLLYNGKKGTGLKYFFYFFYPIHIIILFLIGINLR